MKISVLFTDIGGVMLTNGWDEEARERAVKKFKLDLKNLNERHHLIFDTFEEGKLTLNEYLERVIFHKKRNFTLREFKAFMFAQSQSYEDMINLVSALKIKYNLRVIVISNESRELNDYRIKKFGLDTFVDAFVSSCFVHFRKPDKDIYRIALDIVQVKPKESVFIDDRPIFVEVASSLGINGVHHINYKTTLKKLERFGLSL
jgi:putative hydrolase of the HAD superfamily